MPGRTPKNELRNGGNPYKTLRFLTFLVILAPPAAGSGGLQNGRQVLIKKLSGPKLLFLSPRPVFFMTFYCTSELKFWNRIVEPEPSGAEGGAS